MNPQETTEAPETTQVAQARKKRAAFVGAGVALAVALASGGTVGVVAWHHHNAASAYGAAVEADRGAAADLATAIAGAEKALVEARAAGVDEDSLQGLVRLLAEAKKQTTLAGDLTDSATTRALREGATTLAAHTQSLQVVLDGLKAESVKVGEKTRQVRLEQAREHLTDVIGAAEAALADAGQALTDSEGRVADNQVRADLESARAGFQSQLDNAKTLTASEDVSKVAEAAKNLDEATKVFATQIQAVKDAHTAWEQAQQAQAAANSSSSRSNGGSYSAPTRGGNGGGGYTAPARGGNTGGGTTTGNNSGGWVETSSEETICQTGVLGQDGRPINNC